VNGPFTPSGLNQANVVAQIKDVYSRGIGEWPKTDSIKIGHEASQLTLQIIFRVIGVPASDLEDWGHHFKLASLGNFNLPQVPFTPAWRAARSIAWLGERIRKLVDQAHAGEGQEPTLLTSLVKSKDESGNHLKDDELVRNLRLLGFAGHETTAGVIGYMMTHYASRPELWNRLLEEVEANADCELNSTLDIKRFPFAEAMFRESLRLNPPVSAIFRKLTQDVELHGHVLPKGTEVHISLASRSWDPEQYPNPRVLNPDRWLQMGRNPGTAESIQFGGGPHFCLGYHMAITEGVWFAIYAARILSKAGLRPTFAGETKQARSPMNNLHRDTTLHFVPA
jgi:cytochrome P450 monooxygenase